MAGAVSRPMKGETGPPVATAQVSLNHATWSCLAVYGFASYDGVRAFSWASVTITN